MLECVPNVGEGRRTRVIHSLAAAGGPSLLDLHVDPDHQRCVLTLAGPGERDAGTAARRVAATMVASGVDPSSPTGVHPRLGVLDVVPFVALDGDRGAAVAAAQEFARWLAAELGVPVFLYDAADADHRPLPEVRRDAFVRRAPDVGPARPHPTLGATAVGARPPLVALNCELDRDDLALARDLARRVRERDGGLPGVRALGLELASRGAVQVSMNVAALEETGIEHACTEVRRLARAAGADVAAIELVGLLPRAELARCSPAFLAWSGIGEEQTIEARLARAPANGADGPAAGAPGG